MYKLIKYYLVFIITLSTSFLLYGETLLLQESFEGTNNYEANEFTDGSKDYFMHYTDTWSSITWTNFDGTYLWIGEDTDGGTSDENANPLGYGESGYVVLSPVDVSEYDSVRIKILFGAVWDNGDDESFESDLVMELQYAFDDNIASSGDDKVNTGSYTKITSFRGDDPLFSSGAKEDTDNDGLGDGTILTESLQEFIYTIPNSGSNISIRVVITTDGGSAEYAFDNIRIYGVGSPEMQVRGHGNLIPNKNNFPESTPTTNNFTDFGDVDFGSSSLIPNIRIWNYGTELLDLLSTPHVIISGENASDFEITTQPATPVYIGGAKIISFQFTPSGIGLRTATFTIESNDTKHNNQIYFFDVQGTGKGRPEMEVRGNDVVIQNKNLYPASEPLEENFTDFGDVDVNSSITHSIKIFNNGNDDLNFLSTPYVVISGEHAGDFAITTQPSDPVAADNYQEMVITFAPTASGLRNATVTIESNDYDNSNDVFVFDIQGNGLEDTSLPVELVSFSARCVNHSVLLNWTTESETNNRGFILQRQNTGKDWISIASYQTFNSLMGQGNISTVTDYHYTDDNIQSGETYLYRLADVSTDGNITYHASLSITLDILPDATCMDSAYPNPFNPITHINYQLAEDNIVNIFVYDMLGHKVKTLFSGHQYAGSYNVYWNATNEAGVKVPTGLYLINMNSGNIDKMQKVMLMK